MNPVVVLEARGVRKSYKMGELEVVALRSVDLALREGELLVLLGASGSGKSTLLNILGGLDFPTEGDVLYRGSPIESDDDATLTDFRRRHVGFVFQFYNLVPGLTARENVGLVTDIADEPMSPEDALAMVGLTDRMDHFPAQLSDVLLCDEPTGALDAPTGRLVLEVIERVSRDLGTTTAVISEAARVEPR